MRSRDCKLGLLAISLMFLSACAELTTSPDTLTQAAPASDVKVFMAEPNLYKLSDIKSAVIEGKVGRTASDAVVTMFFKPNGELMEGSELLPLVKDNIQARSRPLSSINSIRSFFRKHNVSVYFTDFTTYKRVMHQLAGNKRVSLRNYTPLEEKYIVSQKVSGIQVYTLPPYANESTAELMADQHESLVFLKQDTCNRNQAYISNMSLVNPTHVSDVIDWQLEDDQLLYPQQTACLASCAFGYGAALTGCAFIPFPGNFICAAFASGGLAACQIACRGG